MASIPPLLPPTGIIFVDPCDLDYHSIRLAESSHPQLELEPIGWRLVSSAYPIWNELNKGALALTYDIVDMAGYGVVAAARARGLPPLTPSPASRAKTSGYQVFFISQWG